MSEIDNLHPVKSNKVSKLIFSTSIIFAYLDKTSK